MDESNHEMDTESKLPKCKISGEDGNVFAIIGRVAKTLTRAGLHEEAYQFREAAMAAKSYDAVLQLCFKYVDVR